MGIDSLSSSLQLNSPESLPVIPEQGLMTELENEIKKETGIFSTSSTNKVSISLDNDLFGTGNRNQSNDLDNLFPSQTSSKSKPHPVAKDTPPKSKAQPTSSADIFDNPPTDIFSDSSEKQASLSSDVLFASSKEESITAISGKKLDSFLGSPSKKGGSSREGEEETDTVQSTAAGPTPDSAPASNLTAAGETPKENKEVEKKKKKATKKVTKGRTDEEIFGNTDDIFGDVPDAQPKKTTKKKKKKTAAGTEDSTQKKPTKKKTKKPVDPSDFTMDADNIFD